VSPSVVMRSLARFFRANPQALVLLVICVVLGLGTFIAVLIAIAQSGGGTPSGEPSDVIALGARLLIW
jgi:hypothetical protein